MKALTLTGKRRLELLDREIPRPESGELLIKVKSVSICGSDLGAYKEPTERFAPPLVLGHEFSGLVEEAGSAVKDFSSGGRVTVNPILYCGSCFYCARGEYNFCTARRSIGTAIGGVRTDGAMREFIVVPAFAALALPARLSWTTGALLEPAAVSLAAAKCLRPHGEEDVFVMGAGPIGLLIIKFLKSLGSKNIIASDINEERLKKAESFGAAPALNAEKTNIAEEVRAHTGGRGASRVIIAAPMPEALAAAFSAVRQGGAVVLVSLIHEKVPLDLMEIAGRGIKLAGSYMFTAEMQEVIELAASGKINLEDGLVSSRFPLERGAEAFELLTGPHSELKVQLVMGEGD